MQQHTSFFSFKTTENELTSQFLLSKCLTYYPIGMLKQFKGFRKRRLSVGTPRGRLLLQIWHEFVDFESQVTIIIHHFDLVI